MEMKIFHFHDDLSIKIHLLNLSDCHKVSRTAQIPFV